MASSSNSNFLQVREVADQRKGAEGCCKTETPPPYFIFGDYLAAMHSNENVDRPQAETKEGVAVYKISFPKARKGECRATPKKKTQQTFGSLSQPYAIHRGPVTDDIPPPNISISRLCRSWSASICSACCCLWRLRKAAMGSPVVSLCGGPLPLPAGGWKPHHRRAGRRSGA